MKMKSGATPDPEEVNRKLPGATVEYYESGSEKIRCLSKKRKDRWVES